LNVVPSMLTVAAIQSLSPVDSNESIIASYAAWS